MDTVASHGQYFSKVSLGQPFPTTTVQKRHALGRKGVPLRRRVIWHHSVRIYSQAGFMRGTVKIKEEEESEIIEPEPSSGTKKLFNLPIPSKVPGTVKLQNKSQSQAKSNKVIFVAGATGKVGSRTVRELLKLGFSIRANTRNVEKAQTLFEDVASSSTGAAGSDDGALLGIFSPAKLFGFLKPKAGKRLEIVECDLEDLESIEPALGNAGVVVCCIGASEKEVLDISGPYRIDFKATENLINAASSAGVNHFVLLTSLGTQKFGFPAAVLNLFWGVLVWKAKAEKALIQSGLTFTIVRPGGMERPTDAYKETHNLLLAEADKLFGGQVSNLQVAELLASIVENLDVSVNKIVEAIAETTAPLRPIKELLEEIPAKGVSSPGQAKPEKPDVDAQKPSKKQEEEKIRALALKEREEKRMQAEKLAEEKRAQAQKEKEEKRIQAERDEKEKQKLQVLRKKYEEEIQAAREKEELAKSAAAAALQEKAELEKRAAEIQAKAEAAALAASQAKAVEAAVLAAARKRNVLSDKEKQKIMESVRLARLPKEAGPAEQPSLKKKPAFSFLGKAAPSSATTETTEPAKEVEEKKDVKSEVKAKANKEAVAEKKVAEAKKKEEQERLEKEAKERAAKEAAEAKQKEAEAKRKEEELAEAKKKEEEEKARREAEAKRKEEELAEAKKKEEEERVVKEAEAKKKEQEETAKKEAEAKKKEEVEREKKEAEAKRKEEELAEAKKKEEEDNAKKEAEMLKAQEEEKAKALAEEEAAKQAALSAAADKAAKEEEPKEAESPAPRSKGFRWFWQPPDPEALDMEERRKEEVADVPVKAKIADQLPPCPTPLSPYVRYPGLKPPAPPIVSPPAPKPEKVAALKANPVSSEIKGVDKATAKLELPSPEVAAPKADPVSSEIKRVDKATTKLELPSPEEPAVITQAPSEDLQDDIEARTQKIQETAAREREALEKAQSTIFFKWPWQKSETTVEESASAVKEEETAASQEPASSVKVQETVSPAIMLQEKTNTLPPSSRPLSPYAQFPNLKPPSPPKPSPAPQKGSATNSKPPAETLASSSGPLSPYPGFPELKPPTSPAPGGNGAVPAVEAKEEEKLPEPAPESGFKWPWQR